MYDRISVADEKISKFLSIFPDNIIWLLSFPNALDVALIIISLLLLYSCCLIYPYKKWKEEHLKEMNEEYEVSEEQKQIRILSYMVFAFFLWFAMFASRTDEQSFVALSALIFYWTPSYVIKNFYLDFFNYIDRYEYSSLFFNGKFPTFNDFNIIKRFIIFFTFLRIIIFFIKICLKLILFVSLYTQEMVFFMCVASVFISRFS